MTEPKSSKRPGANLITRSTAMMEFMSRVSRTPQTVIPVCVGRNKFELQGFLLHLMQLRGIFGEYLVMDATPPQALPLFPFDESYIKAYVYLNGRQIPTNVQRDVMNHRLDRKLIIAVMSLKTPEPPNNWEPGFAQMCAPQIDWPRWSERAPDHLPLIQKARRQLGIDLNREMPELDKTAIDLLLESKEFTGSDDMFDAMERAFRVHRRTRAWTALTASHFKTGKDSILCPKSVRTPAATQTIGE